MSAVSWFDSCDSVLQKIRETQREAIRRAASLIADSLAASGALHLYDNGHCPGEPVGRAGGLMAIHPISVSLNVSHPAPPQHQEKLKQRGSAPDFRQLQQVGRIAVERSNMMPGDCLILMSVSGRNPLPVEMAIAAREMGVKLIAITSLAYSQAVESRHPSGKRLFEAADIVIDNCGVPGDAIVEIDGLETRAGPTSGVAGCYIIWALTCEVVHQLVERGLCPSIYKSVNLPDGEEFNERVREQYLETGL
jgi:uncharacterized phosphosugar-binding protein